LHRRIIANDLFEVFAEPGDDGRGGEKLVRQLAEVDHAVVTRGLGDLENGRTVLALFRFEYIQGHNSGF